MAHNNLTKERDALQQQTAAQRIEFFSLLIIVLVILLAVIVFFTMRQLRLNHRLRLVRTSLEAQHAALENTAAQLQAATAVANEQVAQKVNFLRGMSHEIRTPLNAIVGFVSIIDIVTEDKRVRHTVADINENVDQLLDMTDRLLERNTPTGD
jgi:signal transduction histidine kinase